MPNAISRGLWNLFFSGRRKAFASLPGPTPGGLLGTAGDFFGPPPWQVCARYGREYGGVTLIWLGGSPGLVLNDPDLIGQVLDTRRTEFEKGSIIEQLRPTVTDHSVFIAKQAGNWGSMRRMDPFEQPWIEDWLDAQVGPMRASIEASVDALIAKSEAPFDVVPAIRRLTFDAFAVAAVGERLSDALFEDWQLLAEAADARVQAKLPLSLVRFPSGFAAAKARYFGHFTDRVAEARKAPKAGADDLLSRTMREMPEMDDATLAHVVALMAFGGVFSSSTTLVGALHQLEKTPEAERRLLAEAALFAAGAPTLARLRDARWVEAVVLEAMRILPPVRIVVREPVTDTDFAGVTLPKGTMIMISNQHLHRDPSRWRDPDTFDPARWLDGGIARDPLGSGWFFPFGRGPRVCVAANFGMVYMQTAIATIAARAKVHIESTEPFEEGFFFGVVLPKGVMCRFTAR